MSETVPPVEASDDASDDLVWLTHVSVRLALRRLRAGEGRPLLLLHGLGEHTPAELPRSVAAWPGPVWGLDLTGHGRSTIPFGGGYTAEVLMADVDHALAHLGPVTVLGRGSRVIGSDWPWRPKYFIRLGTRRWSMFGSGRRMPHRGG